MRLGSGLEMADIKALRKHIHGLVDSALDLIEVSSEDYEGFITLGQAMMHDAMRVYAAQFTKIRPSCSCPLCLWASKPKKARR
jgi:hypothetical protein